jgi:2-ketoarginine methyltransferase
MITPDFEHRLVSALQPIRHLALAQGLYTLFDSGIWDGLGRDGGQPTATLAEQQGLDPDRLEIYCHYLANEGYLMHHDGGWQLTTKARELEPFRPWYTLLIGGYTETFAQLGATLRAGAGFATRNGGLVGVGSCGMSNIDVMPMAHRLLGAVPTEQLTVVDLGCGDAAFLIDLVRSRPGLQGIGVEPDETSSRLAAERVEREGLSNRITIHRGRAADVVNLALPADETLCFLTAFVLQEMLEQESEDAVESLLDKVMENYPRAHWLVVEVDHQIDNRAAMSHALATAYYNPYFLLHAITEQRLEKREFWDRLFERAGLETVMADHPDDAVDSTHFEMGYLLRRRARAGQHTGSA